MLHGRGAAPEEEHLAPQFHWVSAESIERSGAHHFQLDPCGVPPTTGQSLKVAKLYHKMEQKKDF